jgi:hypothetical protein
LDKIFILTTIILLIVIYISNKYILIKKIAKELDNAFDELYQYLMKEYEYVQATIEQFPDSILDSKKLCECIANNLIILANNQTFKHEKILVENILSENIEDLLFMMNENIEIIKDSSLQYNILQIKYIRVDIINAKIYCNKIIETFNDLIKSPLSNIIAKFLHLNQINKFKYKK